jgi:hypothetical protein
LFPPLGLRDFSVGDTGALLVDGLGVGGASLPLLPQPAASELTARSAAARAVTARRRAKQIWFTVFPSEIVEEILRHGSFGRRCEASPILRSMSR